MMIKHFSVCVAISMTFALQTQAQQPFQALKEHAVLKKDVGVWTAKGKMWMPGAPEAIEFEGVETNEMVGELWTVTDFRGDFGGMPFRGHGRSGYNPDTKKYEGTWFDSTSPWAATITGTYDESTKTLTSTANMKDPMGNEKKTKSTIVYKDENTRVMTSYGADPNGGDKMVKEMQIHYTRKQ